MRTRENKTALKGKDMSAQGYIGFISFYVCPKCEAKGGLDLNDKCITDDSPGVNGIFNATCTKCGHVDDIDIFISEPDVEVNLDSDGDLDNILLNGVEIQDEIDEVQAERLRNKAREFEGK